MAWPYGGIYLYLNKTKMSKEIEEYYGNTKENRRYKIIIPVGNLTEKEFISLGKISKIFKDIKVEE